MALPTDVGLYHDFNVTDDGRPYGCPGLTEPEPKRFRFPECGVNKIEEPPGSTPLYQIVEKYATDQDAWLQDFVPALEKMLSNGYNRYESILSMSLFHLKIFQPIFL